jgi:hypothetical protein
VTLPVRFWAKVQKGDGCWFWTGAVSGGDGYGRFNIGGTKLAHRIAYEALVGPIPVGLTIDHLCRVRVCVNPAHMEPVTLAENLRRQVSFNGGKERCPQGHEYDYRYPDGRRGCRRCDTEASRRYRERHRDRINQRRRERRRAAR